MGTPGRNSADRSYLSIREVLDLLVVEFPDVTISKIRFLESRGLISPERTPSGYRKFYEPDVSRLRWILRQQREHFLPLKVIKGRLDRESGTDLETSEPSLFDSFAPVEASVVGHEAASVLTASNGSEHTHHEAVNNVQSVPVREPVAVAVVEARAAASGGDPFAAPIDIAPLRGVATGISAPRDRRIDSDHPVLGANASSEDPPPAPVAAAPASPPPTAAPPAVEVTRANDAPPESQLEVEVTPPIEQPRTTRSRSSRQGASDRSGSRLSAEEVASRAGADIALVHSLEEFGLVASQEHRGARVYGEDAVGIAQAAVGFARFGIEPRHLRTFKHAAERETGLFAQVVTPLILQRNPAARSRAEADLAELAQLGDALQGVFVQNAIRDLLGG